MGLDVCTTDDSAESRITLLHRRDKLDGDGRPQFRDPHGRPVTAVPPPVAWTDLGWPRIRAANEALAIDASTIACGWDGSPIDYGIVIADLVLADGLESLVLSLVLMSGIKPRRAESHAG